jgi:hypothetical protein
MSKPMREEKRPLRRCDYKGCPEMVQWFRRYKGEILKLCTKHYAKMAKEHLGQSVEAKDLTSDDLEYLYEKDSEEEY